MGECDDHATDQCGPSFQADASLMTSRARPYFPNTSRTSMCFVFPVVCLRVKNSRPGSGACDMLIVLHELLLSDEVSARNIHLYRVSHLNRQVHEAVFSLGERMYGSLSMCNCSDRWRF